jgi:predicted nuclease of predicted toxin-antitoxin system
LPAGLANQLRRSGHEVADVVSLNLASSSDDDVFAAAQRAESAVVTRDVGFANVERYPPGTHHGIVVLRFPSFITIGLLIEAAVARLAGLSEDDVKGNIVIIEPSQTRIRRKRS